MTPYESLEKLEKTLKELTSTPVGRRVFLLSVPTLLSACASGNKSRHREGDNTGQEAALTVADEKKMTAEYLPEMSKEYPAHKNDFAQKYIRDLGQKIVYANNLHNNPYAYNFTVVETNQVNAFALPAGTVFVTAPLIKMAQSEAELAGVVGHEIGHVQARHTAERMAKAKKEQTKSILYGLGGAVLGGAAGYGLGKALCKKEDKTCLAKASIYGAGAGVAGGLLIQKFAFMANSREDEMEADRIGFKTALKAGYDKDHIGLFYDRLLEMEKEHKKGGNAAMSAFADAMSTHPPSGERVGQMREMARENMNIGKTVTSKDFTKLQSLL